MRSAACSDVRKQKLSGNGSYETGKETQSEGETKELLVRREKRAKQAQRLCEPERDTEKPSAPGMALPPGCPLLPALAQFVLVLKTPS